VNNNIIENSIYDLLQNCTSKKVFVFNKQNKIDEQRNYISNKEIEGITKYKYDKKGYLIESIDYNLKGKIDKKIIFKNDYKGKPIELFEYDSSGQLKRRKNRQYDNNGNVIETIHSDGYKFTSKYDEKNNQIEENTYDGKRGLIQKESTIYGIDKIRVFKKILYEKDYNGNESYKTTKFDKHGNEIEFISKRNEGGRIIFEKLFYDNKYNENGNKVEIKSYFEDKLKTIKTWKYDKTGKIIKFSDCLYGGFGSIPGYSKDDVVTINNYEYDKNNNLIKRIYISSWEGAFIFEKEIEYYK